MKLKKNGFTLIELLATIFIVSLMLTIGVGSVIRNIRGYGTVDIYISGEKIRDDVDDYCESWPKGTRYKIDNIQGKNDWKYTGLKYNNGVLEGVIGVNTSTVYLGFEKQI